ncbi:MAG: S8 family peptidase [Chitinophagaceae bacterium]
MMNRVKQSVLTLVMTALSAGAYAQTAASTNGWHLKDKASEGYYGISLDKAYELVKGKKSKTVIVAVIDSGIDTTHEDLKPILWRNPKEIPGNGIDDDGNGYVDDINGWNFLGGRDGRNVKQDSYEAARVYHKYKSKFADVTDPSTLSPADQELYKTWQRAGKDIAPSTENDFNLMLIRNAFNVAKEGDSVMQLKMGKPEYTGAQLEAFATGEDADAKTAKKKMLIMYNLGFELDRTNKQVLTEIGDYLHGEEMKADAANTAPKAFRAEIVQDNYEDINDRFYGNNDVMANTPMHGTHVSGIIAAVRNNGKGGDGVADNVRIMTIRAVPDGDEHDKDIALAIRYAVDNGAKIINMSFGKGFSPEKEWVDDAVKYAQAKGVLLVHAAGNSAANIDSSHNYPTPVFVKDGGRAPNWITVGASGDPKIGGLVASFSNFGKKEVDVFAPGVKIYSTIPGGNTYGNLQGTSMASPVVAGLAAFILSYYPDLTAEQLKQVIEKSAVAPDVTARNPATGEMVSLSDISTTGGLVNAYEAIKLAESMSGKKHPAPKKTNIKKAKKS